MAYRDVLTQLCLLDPVSGWAPASNPFTRLQQAPRRLLADPALAARPLEATETILMAGEGSLLGVRDGTLLGHLFESLAALCVRVAAQAAEATTAHLRTRDGDHEVDLLVIRNDGRVLALEVKLATTVTDRDVRHVSWLRRSLGDDLVEAVVLTYRRPDGVAVVPLALFGP